MTDECGLNFPFLTYKKHMKAIQSLRKKINLDVERMFKLANSTVGDLKKHTEIELEAYKLNALLFIVDGIEHSMRKECEQGGDFHRMVESTRNALSKYDVHI